MYTQSAIGAELGPGCSAKEARMQGQLSDLRSRRPSYRVEGLEKALKSTSANCTEESFKEERAARMRQAHLKLAEREKDLVQTERPGDADKVKKRRAKVAEARRDLVEAEKS